ncbi:alpha/beta hydrolase fold domain-containing protein [Parafrankia sp. EUN1f]|uniref:alpha/beta hydrolase fold domain-containing protein n=1 Tax=Parafrankia sp. EUN1f TaxID=102897 RepID=UPI00030560F1|nr:alpha/beta hydrolase fold domain-containing protein [Parafrankia sp. EUN1f]
MLEDAMPYRFDSERAALVEITPFAVLDDITASRARAMELILAATREIDLTGVNITDTSVPGPPDAPDVAVRIYTPLIGTRPTPAVLHLRGGGFVAGALGTDHRANIELSRALGAVVISVDYRLAPENPYPAAIEDCYAALLWTVDRAERLGIDPGRIAVHGVNAGAGLAAALTLLTRDRNGPALCFQCLCRPELDDRRAGATPAPVDLTGQAPGARWDAYLGPDLAGTADVPAYAAPARATDLRGLPPAYVSVLEGDRRRDDGVAYAAALRAAGVPVRLRHQPAAAAATSGPAPMPTSAAATATATAAPATATAGGSLAAAAGRCTAGQAGWRRHRGSVPGHGATVNTGTTGAAHGTPWAGRERDDKITALRAAFGTRF